MAHERQLDLMPSAIAAPPIARRYSYYERLGPGGAIANQPERSVVSYGALAPDGAGVLLPALVTGGAAVANPAGFALAARQGFLDGRNRLDDEHHSGDMLPMNFDVAAFVLALQDTTPNELGSHFNSADPFNGIVWISSTWEDSLDGFDGNSFADVDENDRDDDDNEFERTPRPLCGGPDVSQCNQDLPSVNAVRVVNAQTIDPAVLPRGLSVATNLPLYAWGNINTGSLSGGAPDQPRTVDPTGNWVPMMLGGDAVTLLSGSWSNRTTERLLSRDEDDDDCISTATETHVVAAVLAGHVSSTSSSWGGGINNFPRFLECWTNIPSRITGSLVIGFRSVYARDQYRGPNDYYSAPDRFWNFDDNFANPAHQPPGTPSFFVQAVERWDRD